ncbi:MAG: hypothetical protein JXR95_00160 [Deltaproteobacteria bacterium]|nr:hypothetical protein [Deltaproteobacteria bacterium]
MGDRPSWKEIDAKKDRGGTGGKSPRESSRNRRSGVSKADLEKLFSSGKVGALVREKEEEKKIESDSDKAVVNKVKRALRIEDTDKFLSAAEKIIKAHGAVGDFEFLGRCLELRKIEYVLSVLKRMLELLEKDERPERSGAIKALLNVVSVKFGDEEIEELAGKIKAYL